MGSARQERGALLSPDHFAGLDRSLVLRGAAGRSRDERSERLDRLHARGRARGGQRPEPGDQDDGEWLPREGGDESPYERGGRRGYARFAGVWGGGAGEIAAKAGPSRLRRSG